MRAPKRAGLAGLAGACVLCLALVVGISSWKGKGLGPLQGQPPSPATVVVDVKGKATRELAGRSLMERTVTSRDESEDLAPPVLTRQVGKGEKKFEAAQVQAALLQQAQVAQAAQVQAALLQQAAAAAQDGEKTEEDKAAVKTNVAEKEKALPPKRPGVTMMTKAQLQQEGLEHGLRLHTDVGRRCTTLTVRQLRVVITELRARGTGAADLSSSWIADIIDDLLLRTILGEGVDSDLPLIQKHIWFFAAPLVKAFKNVETGRASEGGEKTDLQARSRRIAAAIFLLLVAEEFPETDIAKAWWAFTDIKKEEETAYRSLSAAITRKGPPFRKEDAFGIIVVADAFLKNVQAFPKSHFYNNDESAVEAVETLNAAEALVKMRNEDATATDKYLATYGDKGMISLILLADAHLKEMKVEDEDAHNHARDEAFKEK